MVTLVVRWLLVLVALVSGAACTRAARSGEAPQAALSDRKATENRPYAFEAGARSPAAEEGVSRAEAPWPAARDGATHQAQGYDSYSHRKAPERRPGLATSYGERRDSALTYVRFERADTARPSVMLSLFYNDESGVEHQTGRDAGDATPGVFPVLGGAVEVSIVSSWNNPLPYLYGDGRAFIIGDASDRYSIRLVNHSAERYEVVTSVDGLDVITGTEASFEHHGYILAPWSTLRIEGFRESVDSVRAFRFGEPSESYAVGRGFGRDIGVIGVALFDERSHRRSSGPHPFPGQFAPPPGY